jgi:hypothetical protein
MRLQARWAWVALALLIPGEIVGQQVKATTLPLRDEGTDIWYFYGDVAVGVEHRRGILKFGASVNVVSLDEPRSLLRESFETGNRSLDLDLKDLFWRNTGFLFVGNGPMSAVDVAGGRIRWTRDCDKAGFVELSRMTPLPPTRLLVVSAHHCDAKDIVKALDDPRIQLIDLNTGEIRWTYKTVGRVTDAPGGYWQRVRRAQGGKAQKQVEIAAIPLARYSGGYGLSADSTADRALVAGERLEVLDLANGSVVWRTKDKTGQFEGVFGNLALASEGDELTAFSLETGAAAWHFDLGSKGTTIYSAANMREDGDSTPLGTDVILVSTPKVVHLVDLATGQKRWTVPRGDGAGWQGTQAGLMVRSEDVVTMYDWASGQRRWQVKGGRYMIARGATGGGMLLLVERGKFEEGRHVGPFKFWGVNSSTGAVVWSRADIDGKKIVGWSIEYDGQVRITSEAGRLANIDVASGAPAAAPVSAANDRFVSYSEQDKVLRARNYAGDVVWERRGEISSDARFRMAGGVVLWPAKDGTAEVIAAVDGTSLWKQSLGGNPRAFISNDGRHAIFSSGKSLHVLQISEAHAGAN